MNNFINPNIISKVMASPYCDQEENEKITKALETLTEEDLKIVEECTLIKL